MPPHEIASAGVIALLAGVANVFQTGVNTELSSGFEEGAAALQAAFVNFCVGLLVVTTLACVQKPGLDQCELFTAANNAKWYSYLGGTCGAAYVSCSIFLSKKLGIALYYVIMVTGTLLLSLAIDYRGFLDLQKKPISGQKIVSTCFLVAGCIMVQDIGSSDDSTGLSTGLKVLYSILVFFSGFLLPIQAGLNRSIQNVAGTPLRAAVVSFYVGCMTLAVICVVVYATYEPTKLTGSVWWSWSGGFLGAFFVSAAIFSVPVIGAGWYYCIMIAAQLSTAFVFDSFGFLGYEKKSVTPMRASGVAVAIGSVMLFSSPPIFGRSEGRQEVANTEKGSDDTSPMASLAESLRHEEEEGEKFTL